MYLELKIRIQIQPWTTIGSTKGLALLLYKGYFQIN